MSRTVEFGEEMQEPLHPAIHIKWNHFGVLRRFQLGENEWKFAKLLEKIRVVEPVFSDILCYSDEDGDKIVFSSTTEMDEMLCHFRQLRVSTIKIESMGGSYCLSSNLIKHHINNKLTYLCRKSREE